MLIAESDSDANFTIGKTHGTNIYVIVSTWGVHKVFGRLLA